MKPRPEGFTSSPRTVGRISLGAYVLVMAYAVTASALHAQTPVSRASAVAATLARGPRVALARADSAAASAGLALARQFENPAVAMSYSKSTPQEHYGLDIPIDAPWIRQPRVGAARAERDAANRRFAFATAELSYETDTSYTRALALARRAGLSQRNARDADSLLVLARLRRDAGDASDLDVQLATVFAGQLTNQATSDSLDAVGALLAVQLAMGMNADEPTITLSDSLALDATNATDDARRIATSAATPLLVDAAERDLQAADLATQFERRRLLAAPALSLGFESRDPGGQSGALPTIGIAFPLPVFNRNRAAILVAQAAQARSAAILAATRLELTAAIAQARRAATVARTRAERSARLVSGADNIAALSLLAYREGASTLVNVLEAQRSSRASLAQYIDDLASARNAAGLVRLLSLTAATTP